MEISYTRCECYQLDVNQVRDDTVLLIAGRCQAEAVGEASRSITFVYLQLPD